MANSLIESRLHSLVVVTPTERKATSTTSTTSTVYENIGTQEEQKLQAAVKRQKRSRHIAACSKKDKVVGHQTIDTQEQERGVGLIVMDSTQFSLNHFVWGGKIAHFVFFDVGAGGFGSCPQAELYNTNLLAFCTLHPDWLVLLWKEQGVEQLVKMQAPQLNKMWGKLQGVGNVFYMIDFSRYIILSIYGGVYIDLDIRLKQKLSPHTQYVFASKKKDHFRRITNSFICFTDPSLYPKLLQFIITKFFMCNVPEDWDRHLLHSVGALAFASFCKQMNIKHTFTEECGWVVDFGTVAWKGLNKKR